MASLFRKKDETEEGAPLWMLSFSDLVQQMLCFFVILFSMSTLDRTKVAEAARSFGNRDDRPPRGESAKDREELIGWIVRHHPEVLTSSGWIIRGPQGAWTWIQKVNEGLRITIQGRTLFEEGQSRLADDPETRRMLLDVLEVLHGGYNVLEIRGLTSALDGDAVIETDPRTGVMRANHWLLSYRRAEAVMDWLAADHGTEISEYARRGHAPIPAEQFRLRGDGYARAMEDTSPKARALNRRVEIVITHELSRRRP